MSKRLIGVDIGQHTLRVAVLARDKSGLSLVCLEESLQVGLPDQVARLQELLNGEYHLGDRMAACLPAGGAFIRQLQFPFAERRKIAAALSFELAAQLPVALDDYTTVMQSPRRIEAGVEVVAAAVKTSTLEEFLQPFEAMGVPLQILDLAPYAYAAGLADSVTDALLVFAMEQGTSLALIAAGRLTTYRYLPPQPDRPINERARAISREARGMQGAAAECPLLLAGAEASEDLVAALSAEMERVELLSVKIGDEVIAAPFIPAVALALRAAQSGLEHSFNLRQGAFALRGEWVGLRKALITAACLAGLSLLALGVATGLEYSAKRQQLTTLQQQMHDIYRNTFPGSTAIVDVPLQMQGAIRSLQREAGLIGLEHPSAVTLLRELSELPAPLTCDLDEFALEREQIRIAGQAATFEAVNRMAEHYRTSGSFTKVDVTEAKMGVSGGQVGFRMTLTLTGQGA